jgi:hypothetical protein
MSQYIASCFLDVDGVLIGDFASVTEDTRELRKEVKLMGKTGFVTTRPSLSVTVEYIVPFAGKAFDWDSVADAKLTITYENGVRVVYSGVSTASVGGEKVDQENAVTRTVKLIASKRYES